MQEKADGLHPLTASFDELSVRLEVLQGTLDQLKTLDSSLHEIREIIRTYSEGVREILVLTQDGLIEWVNQRIHDFSGYSPGELVGKPASDFAPPKFRDIFAARLAMIQSGEEMRERVEWPLLIKTREIKYVLPFSYRVSYRGKPAVLSFFYDITRDRVMQEELSLRAEMLDLVSDAVFLLDMDGNIKYVNDAMHASLGYSKDELLKMNIVNIHVKEQRERIRGRLMSASPRHGIDYRAEYLSRDGNTITMYVRGNIATFKGVDYVLCVARSKVAQENL